MLTLLMALPMSVGMKKAKNGMSKWPHAKPAKSNRGFGMEAKSII